MPVIPLPSDPWLPSALGLLTWRSLQVGATVLVVVPFGYAVAGTHSHVLMGAGSSVARLDIPRDAPHDASMSTSGARGDDERNPRVASRTPRHGTAPESSDPDPPPFRITPNRSDLAPGVSPLRLNHLGDETDVEDFRGRSKR